MSSTVRGAALALIFALATTSGALAQGNTGVHPPPPPPPPGQIPPPPPNPPGTPTAPMRHHHRHHHCLWIHHRCYCPCHHG